MTLPTTTCRWALCAAVCCLAWGTAAVAVDSLTLPSGLVLEGDISVENEHVVKIRVNGRMMQFPRSSIASIEYGPDSTAPSQVQKREEDSKEDLKEAQQKVKAIKIRRKAEKRKKKKKEPVQAAAVMTVFAADGTLIIPDQPSEEEKKWLDVLESGKDKIGACRNLARLQSTYAIPSLIRALDDDGPYLRNAAGEALRNITQQNFGFKGTQRKRSIRGEAIKRWQRWYEKASGRKVSW